MTAERTDAEDRGKVIRRRTRQAERHSLGRAMRGLRTASGKTLAEVAGAARVSVSLLSQVERGLTDPSLDSLRDIAEALGTSPFRLLADGSERPRVVHRGSALALSLPGSDVEYELFTPSFDGAFEVGKWTLRPGGTGARKPRGHVGEEANLILSGRVRVEIGDETFELAEGDFITFDARVPHRVTALGDEPASAIFVISPPSF